MNILSSLATKVLKEFTATKFKRVMALNYSFLLVVISQPTYALQITTSIPPLAGMIAPLLAEEDRLDVLLKPGASPHGFQLKPSDLKTLQASDLVISVGSPVDNWMQKPLQNLQVKTLSIQALNNIEQLPIRQGGLWEKKVHQHEQDDERIDEHRDEHHKEHHEEHAEHPSHIENPKMDGHLWISLHNAQTLIKAVSKQLQLMKPAQAEAIQQRTQAWLLQLTETDLQIQQQLQPVKNTPFMVLHDAFQYFEHRYGLNGIGSIQLNPSVSPSLKRVAELRNKIKHGDVRCVFKEPQFPAKRVLAVTNGFTVKVGTLDPIGLVAKTAQQKQTPDYLPYDLFLKQLANQFYDCLATQVEL